MGLVIPFSVPAGMHDKDIRKALWGTEFKKACQADPLSLIIDELGVMQGSYRIDVAVVNGLLHGYEIKSDSDNLERLPAQQDAFSKVFDKLTLVADEKHVEEAVKIVPPWWGLLAVSWRDGAACVDEVWPARLNQKVDAYTLAQLLWRDEAIAILKGRRLLSGMKNQKRKNLWRLLSREVPLSELKLLVRNVLRNRTGWR